MKRFPARLRRPPTTVRWRLTLLYGGLFLVCGAGLLAITYALVAHASSGPGPQAVFTNVPPKAAAARSPFLPPSDRVEVRTANGNLFVKFPPGRVSPKLAEVLRSRAAAAVIHTVGATQRVSDLHQLEIESGIALAIMVLISGLLGWVVAGRVLRPLRTITATTQRLSEVNLHERLSLPGPRDELRTLADTIDGLLERLERAFDAQRRFATNASHELRTPLTASRALLEMAVSDPHATVQSLRAACRGALEEGEQQEQLIESLLSLAQGERGIETRAVFDLAAVTGEVVRLYELQAAAEDVTLELETQPTEVTGDRRLLTQLVSNLIQNAIRHNLSGGEVWVTVAPDASHAVLTVTNTGPQVPVDEIPRLTQPFQRIAQDRTGHGDGLGLGLSIVAAVASAHSAELKITPRSAGGLKVSLRFPLSSDVANHAQDHRAISASRGVEDELQLGLG